MKLSPKNLKRYKEIAKIFWKYGRSDLVKNMVNQDEIDDIEMKPEGNGKTTPEQLVDDLQAMGPTYVKHGQIFASRPDLLPKPYLNALARLQDSVKPFSFEEVKKIVTEELGVLLSKTFVGGLPSRLNRIMDVVTNQELEVKIKAVDAKHVMEGFEKIANRITTGIILAALILGACLLMRIDSSFRLLGYPGLAIVCFLLAATGGFWLVINILVQDHRTRKKLQR